MRAPPCKALREKIEKRNDVKSVRFLNRQDAYNDAIRKIPQFKDLASKDAFPASFVVKLENPGAAQRNSTPRCRASPALTMCSIRRN